MPTYSDKVLALNPLAFWRLGDAAASPTAADSSGNGHTGTYMGSPARVDGIAYRDEADHFGRTFDGVNDYVDFGTDASWLPTAAITIIAWVWRHPHLPANDSGGVWEGFGGQWLVVRPGTWNLDPVHNTRDIRARVTTGGGETTTAAFTTSGIAERWHMMAMTYDGANIKVYWDGQLVSTTPKVGAIVYPAGQALTVGAAPGAAIYGKAKIDEISIHDAALTLAQIEDLWDEGSKDMWVIEPPPSGTGQYGTIGMIGRKIHYQRGLDFGAYDVDTDTWTALASPGTRTQAAGGVIGPPVTAEGEEQFLLGGGLGAGGNPVAGSKIWDSVTNTWTDLPSTPGLGNIGGFWAGEKEYSQDAYFTLNDGVFAAAQGAYRSRVFAIRGFSHDASANVTLVNPELHFWFHPDDPIFDEVLPPGVILEISPGWNSAIGFSKHPLPGEPDFIPHWWVYGYQVYACAICTEEGEIHVFGGITAEPPRVPVEDHPEYYYDLPSLSSDPPAGDQLWQGINSRFWTTSHYTVSMMGGGGGGSGLSPAMPVPVFGACATYADRRAFVIGGSTGSLAAPVSSNLVQVYSIDEGTWEVFNPLPSAGGQGYSASPWYDDGAPGFNVMRGGENYRYLFRRLPIVEPEVEGWGLIS